MDKNKYKKYYSEIETNREVVLEVLKNEKGLMEEVVILEEFYNKLSMITIDEVNKTDMQLLMLPGGSGYENLDKSEKVHELIDYAVENNLYIAAICAAPSILGKKGLLDGKNAVCFPGFEKYMIGAKIKNEKAVMDGKIITAKGAGAACDFGFLMVSVLKDEETSKELKRVMQY